MVLKVHFVTQLSANECPKWKISDGREKIMRWTWTKMDQLDRWCHSFFTAPALFSVIFLLLSLSFFVLCVPPAQIFFFYGWSHHAKSPYAIQKNSSGSGQAVRISGFSSFFIVVCVRVLLSTVTSQWICNEYIYIYIYIRSSTGHWSWSVFQDLFPFLRPGTENTNEPKMIKYAFVRTQSEIGNVHCVPNKNGMEQKRGTSTFHFHFFLFLFFIYLFGGEIRKMSWCRE